MMNKEKPILFSTPMVQAILEGRKTQTRRVITRLYRLAKHGGFILDGKVVGEAGNPNNPLGFMAGCGIERPNYNIGDVLWGRETWCFLNGEELQCAGVPPCYAYSSYHYKADNDGVVTAPVFNGWKPSIHMPKEAARIFLRVTDVRVERVQDISEADAIAEGVSRLYDNLTAEEFSDWGTRVAMVTKEFPRPQSEQNFTNYLWHGHFGKYGNGNRQSDAWEYQCSGYECARDSFSSLWELINAQRGYSWESNPWVWVYDFERITDGLSCADRSGAHVAAEIAFMPAT